MLILERRRGPHERGQRAAGSRPLAYIHTRITSYPYHFDMKRFIFLVVLQLGMNIQAWQISFRIRNSTAVRFTWHYLLVSTYV